MPALSNLSTGEVATISRITGGSPSEGPATGYVEPTAEGTVYASAEAFANNEEPLQVIDLPAGRWTFNTATQALLGLLGEGWVLDEAGLMAPFEEVVVSPLPEWVQPIGAQDAYPLGAWVQHQGLNFESLLAANVWEPSPESNFWRVSPDPGPLPWKQPTGAADAYSIGDRVTHTVAGRETDLWESNINANTTEPGTDGTFDRWWRPIAAPTTDPQPWVQPIPGTANAPYEVDARVTHEGETWKNTTPLNVWKPGVFGWEQEGTGFSQVGKALSRQQELAALRVRGANGEFVADDPATEENEAWLSGEAPE